MPFCLYRDPHDKVKTASSSYLYHGNPHTFLNSETEPCIQIACTKDTPIPDTNRKANVSVWQLLSKTDAWHWVFIQARADDLVPSRSTQDVIVTFLSVALIIIWWVINRIIVGLSARRGLGKPASRLTSPGESNSLCSLPELTLSLWGPWHALPHLIAAVQPKLLHLQQCEN